VSQSGGFTSITSISSSSVSSGCDSSDPGVAPGAFRNSRVKLGQSVCMFFEAFGPSGEQQGSPGDEHGRCLQTFVDASRCQRVRRAPAVEVFNLHFRRDLCFPVGKGLTDYHQRSASSIFSQFFPLGVLLRMISKLPSGPQISSSCSIFPQDARPPVVP
jgi:hypothetical protein